MRFLRTLAALLSLLLLLASCAGTPPQAAERPAAAAEAFAAGLRLIETASPDSLAQAARLFLAEARGVPTAEEQAGLAAGLYGVLYPELGVQALPQGIPPYGGPYGSVLQRAQNGEPPRGSLQGSSGEDGAPARSLFLELVLPHLYLARLPSGAGPAAPREALENLAQAEELNPGSVLPPYLSGRLREAAGELGEAASLYRESLRREQSFYPGRIRLAALLLRQGQAEEASAVLQQVRALLPGDHSVEDLLARAYLEAGKLEEASALVAQALTRDPEDPQNLLLRARILYAQGAWSQALKPLGLLLYQQPDLAEAYVLGAEIHYDGARNPEAALELLEEAQRRFPRDPRFFEASGRILMAEARSAEGLEDLQMALDLDPGRVSTLRLLLADAVRMRRWLQAAIYLAQILEKEQSAQDLRQAWEIYTGLGDSVQALEYAEQLYRLQPDDANRVRLARALVLAGGSQRNEAARRLVEEALGSTQDPALRSRLLVLKARLAASVSPRGVSSSGASPSGVSSSGASPAGTAPDGAAPAGAAPMGEESLAFLREALLADPDNLEAIQQIAAAYLDRRQLREASLYLKRAVQLDPENAGLRLQLEQVERTLAAQAAEGRTP